MASVAQIARLFGWRLYHTYDSRRSARGFPDMVLVRGDRLIFAELKSDRGRLTTDQQDWLTALMAVRKVQVFVFRPRDVEKVTEILR